MTIGQITQRCGHCGQEWWDAHWCQKQTTAMTVDGFFAEAKRLNLRMLGTPEETRAALDLKDEQIAKLKAALRAMLDDDDHDAAKTAARAALDGLGA